MWGVKRLIFSRSAWTGAIAASGVAIAVVAGWACFTYGDVLRHMFDLPGAGFVVGGVFLISFMPMVLRGLIYIVPASRRIDRTAPPPGRWALAWVSFQMACLLASIVLGAAAVAALPFGYERVFVQALMLVLVASGGLFYIGGSVRGFASLARRAD